MGRWEQKGPSVWLYHVPDDVGGLRYVGLVVRAVGAGAGDAAEAWEAIVAGAAGGTDTTIRAGVSFEAAREALESAATAAREREQDE